MTIQEIWMLQNIDVDQYINAVNSKQSKLQM